MNLQLISKYLVYLRQQNGCTQEMLADELQISRQAVSKWETGNSLPDLELLLRLSKLYDITINQILEPDIKYQIKTFEDIEKIDHSKLRKVLAGFETMDIVKASMGTSPAVSQLLEELFFEIDFKKYRMDIGNVKIDEIERIHTQIVSMVNISD